LNLVKSDDYFIANRKFTSCYNIKISNRLWVNMLFLFNFACTCMWTALPVLKGNNSCKVYFRLWMLYGLQCKPYNIRIIVENMQMVYTTDTLRVFISLNLKTSVVLIFTILFDIPSLTFKKFLSSFSYSSRLKVNKNKPWLFGHSDYKYMARL